MAMGLLLPVPPCTHLLLLSTPVWGDVWGDPPLLHP